MATSFRDIEFIAAQELPLDRLLREQHEGASWNEVRRLITTGKVCVDGVKIIRTNDTIRQGAKIELRMRAVRVTGSADIAPDLLIHVDNDMIIINKPAGLSCVPHGDENDTLFCRLERWSARQRDRAAGPVLVVHRLDKETSGLMVFARGQASQQALKDQFRVREAGRKYLAIAHGRLSDKKYESYLVADRGDGRRGSTKRTEAGRLAITHTSVIEHYPRASYMEVRLESGRTHQIRIHLAEDEHPLLGERVYGREYNGAWLDAPRVMLHARELVLAHPRSQEVMTWSVEPPADFEAIRQREAAHPGRIR